MPGANTFSNLGADATKNVKKGSAIVKSCSCHNENASDRYLQLFNTTTVPANGDVPVWSFLVPTLAQIIVGTDFFTNDGLICASPNVVPVGLAFAFSTTKDTYTAGTAGDHSTWINWI